MCKSLKATNTFSHKIKLIYLTANKSEKYTIILVGVVIKNMVGNTVVQSGSCVKYRILGDQ